MLRENALLMHFPPTPSVAHLLDMIQKPKAAVNNILIGEPNN